MGDWFEEGGVIADAAGPPFAPYLRSRSVTSLNTETNVSESLVGFIGSDNKLK